MGEITVLDQQTINQIAAGEVIERPAAVVKELVENSIDAGANAITIEIKEGGIRFIRITDNGKGIASEDIEVAFLRHATSKIRTVEDLLSVTSLGFRGEALSSIAAVGMVELVTKTPEALFGIRYTIEGGEEKSKDEIGCPEGTTFIVRNLFYNTPARRKFLKSATTEAGYIADLVERLAISHPNVSFKFMNNNQLKLHTSGNNNIKDIIYHVYGRDITKNLLEVELEREKVKISGYIGLPSVSRGNRNYENYFINGRYIKSPVICKAIEEAYKPYSMSHKYPFTALQFSIDSSFIDVNVHPTKMEIRFRNSDEIYQATFDLITEALKRRELIPEVSIDTPSKSSLEKKVSGKTSKLSAPEPFESKRIDASNQALKYIKSLQEISTPTLKELEVLEKIKQSSSNVLDKSKSVLQLEEETEYQISDEKSSNSKININIADLVPKQENQSEEKNCHTLEQIAVKEESGEKDTSKNVEDEQEDIAKRRALEEERHQQLTLDKNSATSYAEKLEDEKGSESGKQIDLFEERFIKQEKQRDYRIVGQVFETFWIVEFHDKMLIIDQHVAHEKVLYEKLMRKLEQKTTSSQMIFPPIILTLGLREEEALKKYMGELRDMGFEIEPFGGKEYSVRAVPSDLYGVARKELLVELLDSIVEDGQMKKSNILLDRVATMSCKAAVKGNQKLTFEEMQHLLDELMELENPYFCPHGRPIIVSMSKYEIDKKFKRIV